MMRFFKIVYISIVVATYYCVAAEEHHHKRAPSGFTGVRGKKSIPDGAYSAEDGSLVAAPPKAAFNLHVDQDDVTRSAPLLVQKRAPSGFMGMRGKKPLNYFVQPWAGTYPDNGGLKRAPSGFVGLRGKKESDDEDFYESKRAPQGFFGMRGKKDYLSDKRARLMGFVGMRGKKFISDDSEGNVFDNDEKRAPQGFFGMRGKKALQRQSGFFGMRGKKYPYEFRGKFVGVRGKKTTNDYPLPDYYNNVIEENLSRLGKDLDLNQLMLLLTQQDNNNQADNNVMKNNNDWQHEESHNSAEESP